MEGWIFVSIYKSIVCAHSLYLQEVFICKCGRSRPEVFCRTGVLKNFTKFTGITPVPEYLFFIRPQAGNFMKKETLAQVFSCEFCEFFKNIFFCRTPSVGASASAFFKNLQNLLMIFKLSPDNVPMPALCHL